MASYSLDQVMRAQAALRAAAGLPEERFPVEAFVGMISDEVEQLRELGRSDEEIAGLIRSSSEIAIDGATVAKYYASSAERHGERHG